MTEISPYSNNLLLPSERATLGQSSLATGRLAQNGRAAGADDDSLGVREDGGDGEAAGALDVHEERPGGGDEGLHRINRQYSSFFDEEVDKVQGL